MLNANVRPTQVYSRTSHLYIRQFSLVLTGHHPLSSERSKNGVKSCFTSITTTPNCLTIRKAHIHMHTQPIHMRGTLPLPHPISDISSSNASVPSSSGPPRSAAYDLLPIGAEADDEPAQTATNANAASSLSSPSSSSCSSSSSACVVPHVPLPPLQAALDALCPYSRRALEVGITLLYGYWTSPYFIVHKPSGVPVHAKRRDSLTSRLQYVLNGYCSDTVTAPKPSGKPSRKQRELHMEQPPQPTFTPVYLVHRLDKYTSGALIVATDKNAAGALASAIMDHTAQTVSHPIDEDRLGTRMPTASTSDVDTVTTEQAQWLRAVAAVAPEAVRNTCGGGWTKRYRILADVPPYVTGAGDETAAGAACGRQEGGGGGSEEACAEGASVCKHGLELLKSTHLVGGTITHTPVFAVNKEKDNVACERGPGQRARGVIPRVGYIASWLQRRQWLPVEWAAARMCCAEPTAATQRSPAPTVAGTGSATATTAIATAAASTEPVASVAQADTLTPHLTPAHCTRLNRESLFYGAYDCGADNAMGVGESASPAAGAPGIEDDDEDALVRHSPPAPGTSVSLGGLRKAPLEWLNENLCARDAVLASIVDKLQSDADAAITTTASAAEEATHACAPHGGDAVHLSTSTATGLTPAAASASPAGVDFEHLAALPSAHVPWHPAHWYAHRILANATALQRPTVYALAHADLDARAPLVSAPLPCGCVAAHVGYRDHALYRHPGNGFNRSGNANSECVDGDSAPPVASLVPPTGDAAAPASPSLAPLSLHERGTHFRRAWATHLTHTSLSDSASPAAETKIANDIAPLASPPHPFLPHSLLWESVPRWVTRPVFRVLPRELVSAYAVQHQRDILRTDTHTRTRAVAEHGTDTVPPAIDATALYTHTWHTPKHAITRFRLDALQRAAHTHVRKALFSAKLLTGRTHQLRIHFADSGTPISGDLYYNPYRIRDWLVQYSAFDPSLAADEHAADPHAVDGHVVSRSAATEKAAQPHLRQGAPLEELQATHPRDVARTSYSGAVNGSAGSVVACRVRGEGRMGAAMSEDGEGVLLCRSVQPVPRCLTTHTTATTAPIHTGSAEASALRDVAVKAEDIRPSKYPYSLLRTHKLSPLAPLHVDTSMGLQSYYLEFPAPQIKRKVVKRHAPSMQHAPQVVLQRQREQQEHYERVLALSQGDPSGVAGYFYRLDELHREQGSVEAVAGPAGTPDAVTDTSTQSTPVSVVSGSDVTSNAGISVTGAAAAASRSDGSAHVRGIDAGERPSVSAIAHVMQLVRDLRAAGNASAAASAREPQEAKQRDDMDEDDEAPLNVAEASLRDIDLGDLHSYFDTLDAFVGQDADMVHLLRIRDVRCVLQPEADPLWRVADAWVRERVARQTTNKAAGEPGRVGYVAESSQSLPAHSDALVHSVIGCELPRATQIAPTVRSDTSGTSPSDAVVGLADHDVNVDREFHKRYMEVLCSIDKHDIYYIGDGIQLPGALLLHLLTKHKAWSYRTEDGVDMIRVWVDMPVDWKQDVPIME